MAVRKQSQVWTYITKILGDDGEETIKCNECSAVVKTKQSSTTNLHTHLQRQQQITVSVTTADLKRKRTESKPGKLQTSLIGYWTPLSKTSERHKKITKSIAKYVVLDMRPLESVNDNVSFNSLKLWSPDMTFPAEHISRKL